MATKAAPKKNAPKRKTAKKKVARKRVKAIPDEVSPISAVLVVKSVKPERMAENLALDDFALSDDDMAAISALNMNRRFNDPGDFCEAAFNTFYPIYD